MDYLFNNLVWHNRILEIRDLLCTYYADYCTEKAYFM